MKAVSRFTLGGLSSRKFVCAILLVGMISCRTAAESKPDSGTTAAVPDAQTDLSSNGGADADGAGDHAMLTDAPLIDGGSGQDASTDAAEFGIAARAAKQTCNPPAAQIDQAPVAKLSATGCVDPADPKKPAPSLIPYDVISPLWSDGADKQRFMAIPDGAKIHVKNCTLEPDTCRPSFMGGTTIDEGHWILPVGTVLVKNFLFANKLIETRLFVRYPDMWAGYSYEWNDQQTDADIVDENGLTKDIVNGSGGAQSWYFPSRNDCLECHNETVGNSLGPDTRQFDRSFNYPSGVMGNQIATLEHIGLFDAAVAHLTPLVDYRLQGSSGPSAEDKTRSYLHSNCGSCHRPDGNYSAIDLRFGVPLQMMKICNIDPNKGDQGVTGSKRLFPGDPTKSVMLLRMQAADKKSGRMPQLATSVLDATGIRLVSDWITSITSCPP